MVHVVPVVGLQEKIRGSSGMAIDRCYRRISPRSSRLACWERIGPENDWIRSRIAAIALRGSQLLILCLLRLETRQEFVERRIAKSWAAGEG